MIHSCILLDFLCELCFSPKAKFGINYFLT